jgi:small subunit ribosomal protein S17
MDQTTNAKTRIGTVTSNKMEKTVVVAVERLVPHPKYKKFIRRRNTFKAHDQDNSCQIGDQVLIRETRPLSKTKRWVVVEILQKAT